VTAVVAHRHGGPEVLVVEEVARPPLGEGAVRVAVDAAAVNYPDVLVLAGRYQVSVPLPYTPGCEFCGRVVEVGPGENRLRPGDAVIGLATHGAFAEEVVIEAFRVTRIPADVDRRLAAAFSVTYWTAYHALRTLAKVEPGEWVVVLGAAGGVGLATVDVARALGCRVLAAASGERKLRACREKGAEAVVDYEKEDLKERIRAITGDGADVVVDPVGGPFSEPALRATRWGGRFVVVGFAAGEIPRIPLNLVLLKGVVLTGFENRTILKNHPQAAAHRAEALQLLLDGRVRPHVSAVYPLDEVDRALREVAERRAIGKVVIDVRRRRADEPAALGG
jgi:NADPH2:quinone reductase